MDLGRISADKPTRTLAQPLAPALTHVTGRALITAPALTHTAPALTHTAPRTLTPQLVPTMATVLALILAPIQAQCENALAPATQTTQTGLVTPATQTAQESTDRPIPAVFQDALKLIEQTPTGRDLLEQARVLGILNHEKDFYFGNVSKTDSFLERTLIPNTFEEKINRQVRITINANQDLENMAMDLVHELTHATLRVPVNPYDPTMKAWKYVRDNIEARGGEIDATEKECLFFLEIGRPQKVAYRCEKYIESRWDKRGIGHGNTDRVDREIASNQNQSAEFAINRELLKNDFYRVGADIESLQNKLGSDIDQLTHLSSQKPKIYSSTGQAPYPLALLTEFDALNDAACINSYKRMRWLKAVASSGDLKKNKLEKVTVKFLEQRCQDFLKSEFKVSADFSKWDPAKNNIVKPVESVSEQGFVGLGYRENFVNNRYVSVAK